MKTLYITLVVIVCLLQGCESTQTPQVGHPSASAQASAEVATSLNRQFNDVQQNEQSLEPARNFQRKLIANNSHAPILRLNLASDQPFSFHQEDQVTEVH